MRVRAIWAAVLMAAAAGAASAVRAAQAPAGACTMTLAGELKVEPGSGSPRLKGEILGHPIAIVADTGAMSTLLMESTARRLHVPLDEARGFEGAGAGGNIRIYVTPILDLKIGGVPARIPLMVSSGRVPVDMLLGDDFFNQADVELDLAHDVIRLLRTRGCSDDQMTYWAKGSYSMAPLVVSSGPVSHYVAEVKLNGRPVRAVIDTGADGSVVSAETARDVGLKLTATGHSARGLGESAMAVSVAQLDSFTLGDETIRQTAISVADLNRGVGFSGVDSRIPNRGDVLGGMLLGADFLRAHRVILSYARRKAYFTYAGGPVFVTGKPAAPDKAGGPDKAEAPDKAAPAATPPAG